MQDAGESTSTRTLESALSTAQRWQSRCLERVRHDIVHQTPHVCYLNLCTNHPQSRRTGCCADRGLALAGPNDEYQTWLVSCLPHDGHAFRALEAAAMM